MNSLLTYITLTQINTGTSGLLMSLVSLFIFIVLFLVFRSVVLWYWKVDQIVKNQKEQIEGMRLIVTKLEEIAENTKRADDFKM